MNERNGAACARRRDMTDSKIEASCRWERRRRK
jgi:hypothetical protein